MLEAVFISDLHLHPDDVGIQARFDAFLEWAIKNTQSIYILGDFFHAWAGDDSLNAWSAGIAQKLKRVANQGIRLYYLHGNRDFLLGKDFAIRAGMEILADPTIIYLNQERILLTHGDQYCTEDKAHQWFRWCTRNKWFPACFLKLPLKWRLHLTHAVRKHSKRKQDVMKERRFVAPIDVVIKSMVKHMKKLNVKVVIHGHTHRAREACYVDKVLSYREFVLSDWDAPPKILCYNLTRGLFFGHTDGG